MAQSWSCVFIGDPHLQAAEEGLLEEYRSPNVAQLYDWARSISELSKNRVLGVYGGISRSATTPS